MKNQVIRIIFDDPVKREEVDFYMKVLTKSFGNIAAIEVYEEEFEENENEQMQKEKPK